MNLNDEITRQVGGGTPLKVQTARASHLTPPLSDFEQMTDAELHNVVLGTATPDETRARLQAARDKGYTVLPCSCELHKETGECFGWNPEREVRK